MPLRWHTFCAKRTVPGCSCGSEIVDADEGGLRRWGKGFGLSGDEGWEGLVGCIEV